MLSGCPSLVFKCNVFLYVVVEEINGNTVCICVQVLALADQCLSLHFFSRAELSLSPALLHDLRAALFLQIHQKKKRQNKCDFFVPAGYKLCFYLHRLTSRPKAVWIEDDPTWM